MKSEMEKLKEKQQRRRRKRTLRILAVSPVIALVFVATLSFLTRVSTVVIRNETAYSSVEIDNNLPFSVGDSLFTVNRDKLVADLSVQCPYVKDVNVEFGFPNRIEISLTPATVCFAVRFREVSLENSDASAQTAQDRILLLDEDFKVLEEVVEIPEGILFVDGMDIFSYRVGTVLNEDENIQISIVRDLISNLKRHNLYENVSDIDLSKKYNITMKVHDVIEVELGNSENFNEKTNMLVKILGENDITVPARIRVRNFSEGRYSRLPATDTDVTDSQSSASSDALSNSSTDVGTSEDVEKSENS